MRVARFATEAAFPILGSAAADTTLREHARARAGIRKLGRGHFYLAVTFALDNRYISVHDCCVFMLPATLGYVWAGD